ncbi:MAG: T9SS C-terminal target domain-containing protein [Crocinitomicaceae bacterium]|nr:T9SS C-terminal target domain-containing protein [Crocinitomicaceae bacterium]
MQLFFLNLITNNMRNFTLFFAIFSFATLFAQTPCETGRYATDVFPNFTLTSDIVYGQNTSWQGSATTLKLDFYEPTGDTETARPLIIWVHGGSFIGGSKTDPDVQEWSERFAKKGFACASIDYRLGFFPIDSANAVKAVVRATQDLRAALRYFYKDRATTNTYKIDTTRIYIGGSSAGAITALHVGYLDRECEITDYLSPSTITALGGLEGTSGNPGYSSTVKGILNGCGALARYSWLEAGNIPVASVHGTADGTVKYNRGIVNPGTPLMYLDGSRMIHKRACAVGVENQFFTFEGAPHVPYVGSAAYMDTTVNFFRDFLIGQLGCTQAILQPENSPLQPAALYPINYCDGSPVNEACNIIGLDEAVAEDFTVFPNPTSENVTITFSNKANFDIKIVDLMGRTVLTAKGMNSGSIIPIKSLHTGNYFVILTDQNANVKGTQQLMVH